MNTPRHAAVIGAGTMGLDIAMVFATAGYSVTVRDISDEIVQAAKGRLAATLDKRVAKGKLSAGEAKTLSHSIAFTTDLAELHSAAIVVEAAIEKPEIKKDIFRALDGICPDDTIFATNTSSISITDIASATSRPDRVIGMHFFNPATVMKLVEVIRGIFTSDDTKDAVFAIAEELGKTPVEVNECPGFVVNRILIPMINEAVGLYADGVASKEHIDTAMKLGCNHPMGPLELGDLIGLDIVLAIMEVLHRETGDDKYRPHPYLRKLVRAGMTGRKAGRGIYDYSRK